MDAAQWLRVLAREVRPGLTPRESDYVQTLAPGLAERFPLRAFTIATARACASRLTARTIGPDTLESLLRANLPPAADDSPGASGGGYRPWFEYCAKRFREGCDRAHMLSFMRLRAGAELPATMAGFFPDEHRAEAAYRAEIARDKARALLPEVRAANAEAARSVGAALARAWSPHAAPEPQPAPVPPPVPMPPPAPPPPAEPSWPVRFHAARARAVVLQGLLHEIGQGRGNAVMEARADYLRDWLRTETEALRAGAAQPEPERAEA